MKIFHCFLLTAITLLIFPVLNAQDITGDWYGVCQTEDSLHVNLHIYKDHNRLKATFDSPDEIIFSILTDKFILVEDSLSFCNEEYNVTYKGFINQDNSIIIGDWIQLGNKYKLNFSRKKLIRTIPVNYSSLKFASPKVKAVKSGNIPKIPYEGVLITESGSPKGIVIDTSKLTVLTPGKGTALNPMVYKLPEFVTEDKYPVIEYDTQFVPITVRAKQIQPVQVQPLRIKDEACLSIHYLDIEQGLMDPDIWCILEDVKGNIWFGSSNAGVCRYDGKSLTYFTTKEGLTNNGIRAIIEDRKGNIWIGTDYGLCKYDGIYFTQYSGQIVGGIRTILESKNGNIWIGSELHGVTEIKGNALIHYTESEGLINNSVRAIIEDKDGNIWFGTDGGVCKFNGVSFTHITEKEGLLANRILSIIEDRYGTIWLGTEWGTTKYDGRSLYHYRINKSLPFNFTTSIREENSGYLWFGGAGLNIYDGKSFTNFTIKEGLSNNNILSITEDKCMNLWLATGGSGIMKLYKNSFTYFPQFGDICKNQIGAIMEDQHGNIWFGAIGRGLIKYDGESFMLMTRNEGLNNTAIRSIIEDKNGNIWTDNYNWGLQRYDGNRVVEYNFKEPQDFAYTEYILEDTEGNIWLGTWGKGIIKFDGETFIFFSGINTYQPFGFVTSILLDRNGNIWYGSAPWGLFKYDGNCITQYNTNEGLSDWWITSLFEDTNGHLWIGTKEGGVNKFDGESFKHFTLKEGLCNNNVRSIIEDKKGNIWIGTMKGLSLLSPQGDGNYSIISFGTEDGLKDLNFNENSVCLDSQNRLWWGTGDQVTMLDLNTYEINTKPPLIQLNNIQINEKYIDFGTLFDDLKETKYNPSDSGTRMKMRGLKFSDVAPFYNYPVNLELPHYLNHLTFNFSAIDWSAPQSIRYQYMLEGMDKQWSPLSTENQADYRNIPSGKYKFMVKAISKANIWSETFEYPFTVRPPWWLRWWAYTFYVIVLILLARYYIRYRVGRERIKAEIRIKQVEVDKMRELDQMKSRFFANISHEFRTPLTLLQGPINDLLKNRSGMNEGDRKLLKTMKRNAGRLQQLINQLLDLSRLETGNLKLEVSEGDMNGFIRIIILSFLSLAESKHIKYEYSLAEADQKLHFDSDKVEKITTNLISNALKFTPEGGSVMVTLRYSREKDIAPGLYAKIMVNDTGPGIPDDEKGKIFSRFYQVSSSDSREHEGSGIGLALASELVELYRGKIHVDSEIGKGSIFTVILPVSRELFREDEIIVVSGKPAATKFFDEPEILVEEAASGVLKEGVKEKDKDLPIILIVEDNTDLRKYISDNLLDQYQILEAENGREGLDKAIESIPDLVISDLMMPEMDGMEMCDRLKKDSRTNHIPLIMLTAKADRESKLGGLETGADDYIIKPFDADELQVRVKNIIEQRKKLRERYRKEFLSDPAGHEMHPPEEEFLARLMDCMKKHLEDPEFSVKQLGEELHLSHTQLYRKVLSLTDYTPNEYIRNTRLKMAARMFLEGHTNITAVLYTVGYSSPSYFTQSFRELFGMNPSDYIRQKGEGKGLNTKL